MIVLTSLVIGLVSLLITYKLKEFFSPFMFDIFIVMLMYYLLSFCVVCRYVLFVWRFVYTGELISIGSNCNFVVVYLTFSSPFYSIFN